MWGEALPQEQQPPADPAPFLEILPASASAREEIMHGLLLLVATGTSDMVKVSLCQCRARPLCLLRARLPAQGVSSMVSRQPGPLGTQPLPRILEASRLRSSRSHRLWQSRHER